MSRFSHNQPSFSRNADRTSLPGLPVNQFGSFRRDRRWEKSRRVSYDSIPNLGKYRLAPWLSQQKRARTGPRRLSVAATHRPLSRSPLPSSSRTPQGFLMASWLNVKPNIPMATASEKRPPPQFGSSHHPESRPVPSVKGVRSLSNQPSNFLRPKLAPSRCCPLNNPPTSPGRPRGSPRQPDHCL